MKMPAVLSRDGDDKNLRLRLEIREDLDWFRGHFPDLPVLPGVVQLHWAVQFAREHFGLEGNPLDIQRLKFKSVVTPPVVVDLELTRTGTDAVRFGFSGAGRQYSEGRLNFPGTDG